MKISGPGVNNPMAARPVVDYRVEFGDVTGIPTVLTPETPDERRALQVVWLALKEVLPQHSIRLDHESGDRVHLFIFTRQLPR